MQSWSRTWLKTAGYILTAIYTVGILFLSYIIVMITVLRHPTNVFPPLDAREWLFVLL